MEGGKFGKRFMLHLVNASLLLALFGGAGAAAEQPEAVVGKGKENNTVTFRVYANETGSKQQTYRTELVCSGDTKAQVVLSYPSNAEHTVFYHAPEGQLCHIAITANGQARLGDELQLTVRQGDDVVARGTRYPDGAHAVSPDFLLPGGPLTVEASQEFTNAPLGTQLRTMVWNLWGGGREAGGEENVRQIVDVIRHEDPDIMFTIETYQSGATILAGLNEGQEESRRYTAFQVTRDPVHQPLNDNLWIYTRYPIVKEYPIRKHPGLMNDFHFGGVKVQLPDGQQVNVFNTWLYHEGGAMGLTNQTVGEVTYGLPRTYTDAEILATDLEPRRIKMIRAILNEDLPALLGDDSSPILMAGDFNTLSSEDWSSRFASAPGHAGLVLPWPVTGLMKEAGFTDTYRWANPDAALHPGSTWSPYYGYGMSPGRIDYIWTKGKKVRVLESHVRNTKLPEHAGKTQAFYSDHAAVITDLMIRNLPDEPQPVERILPYQQMKAVATSQHTGYEASKAIDGNLKTMWHSEWSPLPPLPQSITLDLGGTYHVTGLDYRTRTDFKPDGLITGYAIYASEDGQAFTKVTEGVWKQDYHLQTAAFDAQGVRYLRLEATSSSGNVAAASEISVRYIP
ncbi:hypothetical protein J31TS4_34030 [Paenibacillus sp. J31TS4]|uniref:discoidin domain-containing protein n=1 Tax=Paenibacillus sp. J31TS4 TaxID=2807195 RepID=UPI001B1828D9|nr:discoidin domain-containing protein [Paenibacillus sp. J31TS4]GIP40123.1 hypothetical protein J31TS4_34030 [Paenibacillus sp. J31TS4]